MLSTKAVLMVVHVCLFLVLGPLIHALARAHSRQAFVDQTWDRDEAWRSCLPAWHDAMECEDCRKKRALFQVSTSRGVIDAQTEEASGAGPDQKPELPKTVAQPKVQRKSELVATQFNKTQKSKEKPSAVKRPDASGWLQVSFAYHRARDAVLWVWHKTGHNYRRLSFVQTARHWAASRVGAVDVAIWVSVFSVMGLVLCLLMINTISLRRHSPAEGVAPSRTVSETAVYAGEPHRLGIGSGSLLSSKVLTPQATSTQLDTRRSIMDVSPHNHYIGTPGPSLTGPYLPPQSPEPSSMVPPARNAPVNPKRFCPQLCPGLVVPLGSECILAVQPVAPMPSSCESKMTTVQILDLCGKPVLKATVCRMRKSSSKPAVTLRMLESPHGRLESSVLATCSEDCAENGHRQMCIRDSNNKIFGHLGRDLSVTNRYMLQCVSGTDTRDSTKKCTVSFEGSFGNHKVLIQNDYQEQLADSEECVMNFSPCTKFYKLRVASGVDVGLMICCLVSIDELEVQVSREPLSQSDRISGGHNPWP